MAHLILHVADASVPEEELEDVIRVVDGVLDEIAAASMPRLLVLNKCDLLDPGQEAFLRRTWPDAVLTSALTGAGLDTLRRRIADFFNSRLESVELFFPYGNGRLIGEIYRIGTDVELENRADGVVVRARLPRDEAARFARFKKPPADSR